jgi:hypothetical protein
MYREWRDIRGGVGAGKLPALILTLEVLSDILDRFAHFTASAAEALLHVSSRLIRNTFVAEPLVVSEIAPRLLHTTFYFLTFAFQLVTVHG